MENWVQQTKLTALIGFQDAVNKETVKLANLLGKSNIEKDPEGTARNALALIAGMVDVVNGHNLLVDQTVESTKTEMKRSAERAARTANSEDNEERTQYNISEIQEGA